MNSYLSFNYYDFPTTYEDYQASTLVDLESLIEKDLWKNKSKMEVLNAKYPFYLMAK